MVHSIVPHHHHDANPELAVIHTADHEEEKDCEDDADEDCHYFKHIDYSASGVITTKVKNLKEYISLNYSLVFSYQIIYNFITLDKLPHSFFNPDPGKFSYKSPDTFSTGLRGPPSVNS